MNIWQFLDQQISDTTGKLFWTQSRLGLGGGCINEAAQLKGESATFFVKLNQAHRVDMFTAEARGLQALAAAEAIRIPKPVCFGAHGDRSYLVLEYVPMRGQPDAHILGTQLAKMHQCTQAEFGWSQDNTIGSTRQVNTPNTDWVAFWREHRLGFQLDLAAKNGIDKSTLRLGGKLLAEFPALFSDYTPVSSLLHGDLWSGNWACDEHGQPVIFDPAVYFGDHEAELAMMELFGSPGRAFFSAYEQVFPIDQGYSVRKTFYNLYHILNHYNLFGGGYGGQAHAMMERVLAEISG